MTRLGEKLRATVVGQLVARADEAERQRDDARGAKDQALSQLAAVREAHELSERAGNKLSGTIDAARAVLREGGHLTYSSLSLADDVATALARGREERDHAREAADAWRPGPVPPRAQRLIEEELWVHAVAAHDRGHVMFSGRARGYTDRPTFVIELADGTRSSWVADLVVEADEQRPPADLEETRDETVRRLAREIIAARAVLAPDVSTAGTPLEEVARTALKVARATSVAAELRWWVEPGNAPGQDMVPRALLAKRAAGLDPGGGTPQGRQPPTPAISHDDFEVRGTDPHATCDARIRNAFNTMVEIADAAGFEHDGQAIDARALVGFVQALRATSTEPRLPRARRAATDAQAGHPDEVLAALRAADRAGEVHAQPGYRIVHPTDLSYTEALVVLARAVRAYGEQPDDPPVPDEQVEQVAREAAHQAVVDGGVERALAPEVVDALARAGFVPGVYPPGMAIDGDMLQTLVADALPRWATDEFAGELADSVLDAAVQAGFTILHGPGLTPRPAAEPEQHWAEQAIERAREYLASLGYRRIVDDHGEDLVAMLREIGVAADSNSTRLALIDEHLVSLGIVASSDDRIVDGVGQLAQQYVELRERATRVGSPAGGGIFEISRERTSQQYDGGYTLQHDDQHTGGELARAARAYLVGTPTVWPRTWGAPPQLPDDPVERLAKAGALIAAEIDRLRRAENRAASTADDGVAPRRSSLTDRDVCEACARLAACEDHPAGMAVTDP